jgi:purine-binding chemotaxis protein CheW
MSDVIQFVSFRLEQLRVAVLLSSVDQVVRAAELMPLPGAPEIVLGALNVRGEVLPALDMRSRFGTQSRSIKPSDQFLIARAGTRRVVLPVDEVQGLLSIEESAFTAAEALAPGLKRIEGVARLPDGLVLIHDLETFLSSEEAQTLDTALQKEAARA